jgi:hypothetical protein
MADNDRYGSKGQRVKATTNSFEITRLPVRAFYQFDGSSRPYSPVILSNIFFTVSEYNALLSKLTCSYDSLLDSNLGAGPQCEARSPQRASSKA